MMMLNLTAHSGKKAYYCVESSKASGMGERSMNPTKKGCQKSLDVAESPAFVKKWSGYTGGDNPPPACNLII
tara:strand:- start:64550 stop:64765 length:216 start_codon:yes stop_codon:yes gene_type:complete